MGAKRKPRGNFDAMREHTLVSNSVSRIKRSISKTRLYGSHYADLISHIEKARLASMWNMLTNSKRGVDVFYIHNIHPDLHRSGWWTEAMKTGVTVVKVRGTDLPLDQRLVTLKRNLPSAFAAELSLITIVRSVDLRPYPSPHQIAQLLSGE